LGIALIGGGAFWWVRSSRRAQTIDEEFGTGEDASLDAEFESLLAEIAQLDQRFEQGELDEAAYREKRSELMAQAKAVRSAIADEEATPEVAAITGGGVETVEP
jgi:hypothetical protein